MVGSEHGGEEQFALPTAPLIPGRKLVPSDLFRAESWYEGVRDLAAKVASDLARAEEALKDDESRARLAGLEGTNDKQRDADLRSKMAPHYSAIRILRDRKIRVDVELDKARARIGLYQELVKMGYFALEE